MIIVFFVLTLSFYLVEVVAPREGLFIIPPGGGYTNVSGGQSLHDVITREWSLDQPMLTRYLQFLGNVLSGNLGTSVAFRSGVPVWQVIAQRLPTTLFLVAATLAIAAVLGLASGVPLSRRRGRLPDTLATVVMALLFSVPIFALAMTMIMAFAVAIPWFPVGNTVSSDFSAMDPVGQLGDRVWHLTLPVLVLVANGVGLFTWSVRDDPLFFTPEPAATIRNDSHDVVRHGRLDWLRATISRVLPAAATYVGWTLGVVMVVEWVFQIEGIGNLLFYGLLDLDGWIVLGVFLVSTLLIVLPVVIAADILHYWLAGMSRRPAILRAARFKVEIRDMWRGFVRIVRNPLGLAGLILILALVIMSAAAPLLVGPYPTALQKSLNVLQPPSSAHPLGTDREGYDILALVVYGGQGEILPAVFAFALALVLELAYVAALGLFGARADPFLGLPADFFLILPWLPFSLLALVTTRSITLLPLLFVFGWPVAVRLLRNEVRGLRESMPGPRGSDRPVVSKWRTSMRFLWGTGPFILANALFACSLAIGMRAALEFIGARGAGPTAWGTMLRDAFTSLAGLQNMWWYILPPLLCLLAAILGPLLLSLAVKQIGLSALTQATEETTQPQESKPSAAPTSA